MNKQFWPQIIATTALVILVVCHVGCDTTSIVTETDAPKTTETKTATTTTTVISTTTTTQTVTTTVRCVSSTIPADFYIIYASSWANGENTNIVLLDTQSNTIGAPAAYPAGYISTGFYIPCEDLQAIYNAIIQYDIKSYGELDLLKYPEINIYPRISYKVTFCLDGVIYSVLYDNTVVHWTSTRYPDLRVFHNMLNDYYESTDEFKSFPRPPGLT